MSEAYLPLVYFDGSYWLRVGYVCALPAVLGAGWLASFYWRRASLRELLAVVAYFAATFWFAIWFWRLS